MRLGHCLSMLALGLLAVRGAHADELTDLRATLAGLHADAPFAATLDVRNTRTSGDKDKPRTTHAQFQVSVSADAKGLRIGFPTALLQHAASESTANAKDPDKATPTVDLLGSLGPVGLQAMVDFAPELLLKLQGAKLDAQRDETHDGVSTHLLVFDIPPGLGAGDRDAIKHYQGQLKVWLGKDGVPVAAAESRVYKGRKFFISFETSMATSCTLRRIGTRLVVVSEHSENKGSGFGQVNDSVGDTTLVPTSSAPAG